ncbi:hypothetical protein TRFO_13313 [Tritrichomonas foetus]|uniref:Uncharacterized protein n=1 Tax=Tritrichomonas foetus TaxID=1144522 RepID=A0A1J4L2U7_9EUKA|nr:hypothetical protein TRFO_13313 [Tritrichomonas foetus]|eukprot:OHT16300.1 hypothetical protein TRFO_13313 [Tritrichomonas foetus]
MSDEIPVPQSLAMFECGEPKSDLHFALSRGEDGTIEGAGEDKLNQFFIQPADITCSGTLLIRNKKTGEIKSVPVNNYLMISRQSKLNDFEKLNTLNTADLVNQFGTRQAKRIYSMRQATSK